jgi:hypothetical protein
VFSTTNKVSIIVRSVFRRSNHLSGIVGLIRSLANAGQHVPSSFGARKSELMNWF